MQEKLISAECAEYLLKLGRFMFWTFPNCKYIQMYTYVLCIQSTYKTIVKEHRAATNALKL